ncbi:LptF/LptG family permease [Ferruginibacter yonginensis]|uniref:LptF/LptG family permease n=1 Tax=Ferruginibacter yonginensis TaxID=1310416 RepID=A0ABV8QRF8_9BACT
MIKKLDKLILKSFFGPFIVTFFIAFFVLMMQTLWKYIDDLVGKGLPLLTILKFVWYASATLSSLAMPIAILISSIMTFGNLGESFELVAIKSSGISLLRFMRPLIWVTVGLCIITFLFANYVIPYSQLKFVTLYKDILVKKPALNMKQGVFYTDIERYAIKVGKKNEDGKDIEDVLIYEQNNALQENTIVAKAGKMDVSADNNYLQFYLQDGNRYQEKGEFRDTATEYVRLKFKTFKKLFDLSSFNQKASDDKELKNNFKMLSAVQLDKNIDSLQKFKDSVEVSLFKNVQLTTPYLNDTSKKWAQVGSINTSVNDKIFPDSVVDILHERAFSKAAELKNTIYFTNIENAKKRVEIMNHKLEWQRKFSFSLACMVLFFIGAPLGSIIRKGGLGMPLVVAIVFFLLFHLLNMFGEKFVKSELLPPFWGMWLAVIVLTPVGIFFTYKAMHDSQLFNKELYTKAGKKIAGLFKKSKAISPSKI